MEACVPIQARHFARGDQLVVNSRRSQNAVAGFMVLPDPLQETRVVELAGTRLGAGQDVEAIP